MAQFNDYAFWEQLFTDPQGIRRSTKTSIRKKNRELLRQHFRTSGFTDGLVELCSLDVSIKLKPNNFYIAGEVEDISEVVAILNAVTGKSASGEGYPGSYVDIHFSCKLEKGIAHIVLVREGLDDLNRIASYGHEDGHFIWTVKQQALIYNKYGIPKSAQMQIKDDEDFANFCGNIALYSNNRNLVFLTFQSEDENKRLSAERMLTLAKDCFY